MGLQGQLRIENLTCVRGGRELFAGLDLSLKPGEAALITGPNGVGKSSLMRLIAGLLDAADGKIEVIGSLAFANSSTPLDAMSVLKDAVGFWVGGAADDALRAVELDHLANVPVRILSTGQCKRAVLACVIGSGADIWLLDEPANGLDADAQRMLEEAVTLHRQDGGIAIVATHQPIALPDAKQVILS